MAPNPSAIRAGIPAANCGVGAFSRAFQRCSGTAQSRRRLRGGYLAAI
jgi:hypothetical protein